MTAIPEKTNVVRISVNVRIRNLSEPDHILTCNALVDTGSGYMVLPRA
jgi:predicted aspartyl protease